MKLLWDGTHYVFECNQAQSGIPKRAGFTYWKLVRDHWATKNPHIAARLCKWADDSVPKELRDVYANQRLNYTVSFAETGDADLPHPKGLDYLPFQKAAIKHMTRRLK